MLRDACLHRHTNQNGADYKERNGVLVASRMRDDMKEAPQYTAEMFTKLTEQLNRRHTQVNKDLKKVKQKKWTREQEIDRLLTFYTKVQTYYQGHAHRLEALQIEEVLTPKRRMEIELLDTQIRLYSGKVELLLIMLEKQKDESSMSRLFEIEETTTDWISDRDE